MPHVSIARFLAKRVARRVLRGAVERTITDRDLADGRRRVEARFAGESVGVTLPRQFDSLEDAPL